MSFQHSLLIGAPPAAILAAFFDPEALRVWWRVAASVTTPRPLGIYAVQWEATRSRDDVLGPLGGVFYGSVLEHRPDREFFLGECFWLPPEGDPIGPMAMEVSCAIEGPLTRLSVRQSGYEESARWRRYYSVITPGWKSSLRWLKRYLEEGAEAVAAARDRSAAPGPELDEPIAR